MSGRDQTSRSDECAELRTRLGVDGQNVDWFLQELIDFVNLSEGNEIGVTLHIEGSIVTGNLINAKRWFVDLARHLGDAGVNAAVSKWIEEFGEVYVKRDEAPEEDRLPPVYLHLSNARTVGTSGDSVPTDEGVYWRGRVNAVSGFNLGTLGPAKE